MKSKIICLIVIISFLCFFIFEIKTSYFQSLYFVKKTSNFAYLIKQKNNTIIFPKYGPSDERLGYTLISELLNKWDVVQQANWSVSLSNFIKNGYYLPYFSKQTNGLVILDSNKEIIQKNIFPKKYYKTFDEIPSLVLETLLFIEDREILTKEKYKNPVIDFDRLVSALYRSLLKKIGVNVKTYGASTLVTQLTKFKHSKNGKTDSFFEKFKQMVSASALVYSGGRETIDIRKKVILDFINQVPLGSIPNYGEVNGIGDGLMAWFGADLDEESRILKNCNYDIIRCGNSYRMFLALFLSQRRPTYYLINNREDLNNLVDLYLPLLYNSMIISSHLKDEVSRNYLLFSSSLKQKIIKYKTISDIIKTELLNKLKIFDFYTLDRLDLTVESTINKELTEKVKNKLDALVKYGDKSLVGNHLLKNKNQKDLIFSFLLYEKLKDRNVLRVNTDQYYTKFNLNDGMKLELGSTAKLRTFITYLEMVEEIYLKLINGKFVFTHEKDELSNWVVEWMVENPNGSLQKILEDSIERKFSGNEGERFFTGGGIHYFNNFEGEGGGLRTVKDGLYKSINLVYIRVMKDIVNHLVYSTNLPDLLLNFKNIETRKKYLDAFVEKEGDVFIGRYFLKYYKSNNPIGLLINEIKERDKNLSLLVRAKHLLGVYRITKPKSTLNDLWAFLYKNNIDLHPEKIENFYKLLYQTNLDLQDFGYLARKHPLEIWVANYLNNYPFANLENVKKAAFKAKKESYRWFYSSRKIHRQNVAISILLEEEAFSKIEYKWKRLGFPFKVVPSYASAIGSSGDKPEALARLIGIIINNGKLCNNDRIEILNFAKETPYETVLKPKLNCKQVLSKEISYITKKVLQGVVEKGTAIRLFNTINGVAIGGKTGTGDNRFAKIVKNRTGTFVFYIGDRYFGVITVFVNGREASKYSFTSSLPLQTLKLIIPILSERLKF